MRPMTKEWLKAANDDLLTIGELIHNPMLTNIAAFHAEQCVEKSLKAILEDYQVPFSKIHSLIKLKKMLPVQLDTLEDPALSRINELYIESRYPGDLGLLPNGKPALKDAKEFYDFAQEVFAKVCKLLDVNPSELT